MQVQVTIDQSSTTRQLTLLGNLFLALADEGIEAKPAAPIQAAVEEASPVTAEEPKRRRRTKAEIEAEKAAEEGSRVAQAEAAAQQSNEAGLAEAEETAQAEAAVTTEAPAQAEEPVESAGEEVKVYTQGEVQLLASELARRSGPEVVLGLIKEFGASRIGDMDAATLAKFATKLKSL